ncbi:ribbon-helix-helix domain-containing protein [Sphingomonas faeni]|uniref:ribbon-helix-helix domain-containing protein n=1 Tax=Sphingomonas faeni TaxID=185950 RepID=UPI003356F0BA
MAQISVSLPDDLMAWAERQVAEGRYDSLEAYVADLVARDIDDATKLAASNAVIEEGLSSEPTDDSMADMTARRDRDDDTLGALRRSWAQGIGSGPPVDGNFNAADIARRDGRPGEAVRKHG